MPKFNVIYEKPRYFLVEVDAANAEDAEATANQIIDAAILDEYYYAEGDLEISNVEPASA